MLLSYTPKKNKKVLLISSMHFAGDMNENSMKPEIIDFYNIIKGGVDVLDKLCHDKTTWRKTLRWPIRYFYEMEMRLQNPRLPRELGSLIGKVLGKEIDMGATSSQSGQPAGQKKIKRCDFCDPKKDRKGYSFCGTCNKSLCGEHKRVICPTCDNATDT
ncbi:uncharacterized protein LOC117170019 [Belonocnema kinseyi]|uniref:uncharacterized protein LOC117170019 n=1 Tax=Belonocnema kinseyi TaxID=2817044 RepID=UPI00143CFBB9|nr:uncharacterized protein LOC117170019 [Belonocnema kinseyi]